MDVVFIVVLLFVILLIFKSVDTMAYVVALTDIFFRIIAFINSYIPVKEINKFLNQIPSSIPAIINKYTGGIISDILMWALVICYAMFEVYVIRVLWKKR